MLTPIGEMREPARILTQITTVDASGGEVQGYGQSDVLWISVRAMSTKEGQAFNQVEAEVSHVAFGHYGDLASVTSKDRVRLEETGEEFDIVGAPVKSPVKDWIKLNLLWRENA